MLNKYRNTFIILLILFLFGCTKKETENIEKVNNEFPELEYIAAKEMLDNGNFDLAQEAFSDIEKRYPLSNWALKSKIMNVFIYYLKLDYENAALDIERFINKYPDYKDIDYAYYLKALISYEQIKNPALDATYTNKSLENFEELIRRFPDSKYSKDAQQKIILIKTILAGKDMHIGFYYLKQEKYLSALNRYRKVVNTYEPNRYTPEALHRIVEIYYALGMLKDAEKFGAVLGYNYPESIWYERTYSLIGNKEILDENDKSWVERFFKKN